MKLREFYETLNKDIPFNELSVERMDILEQSEAYKTYCTVSNYCDSLNKATNSFIKLGESMKALKRQRLINNLKYIGNVLLCGFMAIIVVIFVYKHIMDNM